MLHTPNYDAGGRAFCGPTAIAAVTGMPISRIYRMMRRIRAERERRNTGEKRLRRGGYVLDLAGRKMPIKGMYPGEMLKLMKRAGFKVTSSGSGEMTLGQFLEDRGHLGPMIVEVTRHFIAVSKGMICDTRVRQPAPWSTYPKMQRRVQQFWMFSGTLKSEATAATAAATNLEKKTMEKKPTLQERRHIETVRLVEKLSVKREAAISTLIKTEAKLIDARRALARSEKRLQAATPAKPGKAVTPASAKVEPATPPPAPKEAPAPASVDPAAKAAKLRDELRGERPRGRRRGPVEAAAPSA